MTNVDWDVVDTLRDLDGRIDVDPDGLPFVAYLMSLRIRDEHLSRLQLLPSLADICFDHNTNITDVGIANIDERFYRIERVSLEGTSVSEAGINALKQRLPADCEVTWSRQIG